MPSSDRTDYLMMDLVSSDFNIFLQNSDKKISTRKNSELTCAEIPQAAGIISFFFSELDNIFPIL